MTSSFQDPPPEIPKVPSHIADLAGRCLSGNASEEDWKTLSDLMEVDDRVLDYYAAYSELHATLIACTPLKVSSGGEDIVHSDAPQPTRKYPINPLWFALAVLAASIVVWLTLSPEEPQSRDAIARCVFSTANDLRVNGELNYDRQLFPGSSLQFSEGTIGLSLAAGVDLVIDGPAELELVSRNHLNLLSGKLIADAQEESEEISIKTTRCVVNDKGGRFGLASFVGQPDSIAVFQGTMQVSQYNRSHQLKKGEAIRVETDGGISRLTTVLAGLFPNEKDINRTTLSDNVIQSVTDNVDDNSVYAFYHVAPGRFGEDMPAYVDRSHQWNSIGPGGMPSFLRGGEYVMTLNDDRFHEKNLRIDLTLGKPATVYVLYTECLEIPDWLTRDFVDTGFRVGLDEGPYFDPNFNEIVHTECEIATGANNSVDSNFAVWKREISQPGIVQLGGVNIRERPLPEPIYGGHNGSNMYGIVVQPLSP
ncbi:hypothetical protein AB1K70_23365 [Bremerella sp. JC770]|uniref:hypothetical protein n=1 Tax=Bremerella sp. JC770 TaxID=3232137 RepID=UPI00345B3882